MIAQTYYMVNECHLSLGPNDKLEEVSKYIYEKYKIKTNIDTQELLILFKNKGVFNDSFVKDIINGIKTYVPFCLLSPFINVKSGAKRYSPKNIALFNALYEKSRKDSNELLPYHFGEVDGINTKIILDEYFTDYLINESKIIQDFCTFNLIEYLQTRNPNVPGIINKLLPQLDRNIDIDIKKFYKYVIDIDDSNMKDIYSETPLKEIMKNNDLSIDHFVPWTYVTNDEMWNLTPTTITINSSKSNTLPNWELYYNKFLNQKWTIYNVINKNYRVKNLFDKLSNKFLNVSEIFNLYYTKVNENEFKCCYQRHIKSIYDSAERNGFKSGWEYHNF